MIEKLEKIIQKAFPIICDGSHTASELIVLGKYDSISDMITDKLFLLKKHSPRNKIIEFVSFNHYNPTFEEVLIEFARRGLERPDSEDAFYFGIQYPDEQKMLPIFFLHEPVHNSSGNRFILALGGGLNQRYLYLSDFDSKWYWHCVFAATRST